MVENVDIKSLTSSGLKDLIQNLKKTGNPDQLITQFQFLEKFCTGSENSSSTILENGGFLEFLSETIKKHSNKSVRIHALAFLLSLSLSIGKFKETLLDDFSLFAFFNIFLETECPQNFEILEALEIQLQDSTFSSRTLTDFAMFLQKISFFLHSDKTSEKIKLAITDKLSDILDSKFLPSILTLSAIEHILPLPNPTRTTCASLDASGGGGAGAGASSESRFQSEPTESSLLSGLSLTVSPAVFKIAFRFLKFPTAAVGGRIGMFGVCPQGSKRQQLNTHLGDARGSAGLYIRTNAINLFYSSSSGTTDVFSSCPYKIGTVFEVELDANLHTVHFLVDGKVFPHYLGEVLAEPLVFAVSGHTNPEFEVVSFEKAAKSAGSWEKLSLTLVKPS